MSSKSDRRESNILYMEFGITTFGEVRPMHVPGGDEWAQARVAQILEEASLADSLGLDVYALGEHHRPDFVVSAPEVLLAGIAGRTERIRLSSAVTVLGSADPVRVYQNFATLDLVSGGRAEIMAGRGSFIESFPLFGFNLEDYDALFSEALDLLLRINSSIKVNWEGRFRAPLHNAGIYPRAAQPRIPVWLAVGGTPASFVRAGKLGLPLSLAILGGSPRQFLPLIQSYRQAADQAGFDGAAMPLAIAGHLHMAEDDMQAADEYWPVYEKMMNRIGRERGWQPFTRDYFEALREDEGSLLVGSPERIMRKLRLWYQLFKHSRQYAQIIHGMELPFSRVMDSVKLYAQVANELRGEMREVSAE